VTAAGDGSFAARDVVNSQVHVGDNNFRVQGPRHPSEVPPPKHPWQVPVTPKTTLFGREDELAALRRSLLDGGETAIGQQAVHGLGGVGKTTLALHYAWQHRGDYALVAWVTADDPNSVLQGLAHLALVLEPAASARGASFADDGAAATWARQWLQDHADWLLILDNVEDPRHVQELLSHVGAAGSGGHVLITTRRVTPAWDELGVRTVLLDVLGRSASVELLLSLSKRPDTEEERREAAALAEELGDLPLALKQAGAYTASIGASLAEYRALLAASPARVYGKGNPALADEAVAVRRTWRVTVERIARDQPSAVLLLGVLARLSPDLVPVSVLVAGKSVLEALDIREDLALLASYSLLNFYRRTELAPGGAVIVHRLVQAITRLDDENPAETYRRAVDVVDAATRDLDPEDSGTWPAWRTVSEHATHLLSDEVVPDPAHPEHDGPTALRAATAAHHGAWYVHRSGLHRQAEEQLNRVLGLRRRLLGDEHRLTLLTAHDLARVIRDAGRWDEAQERFETVLATQREHLGEEDADTVTTRSRLAGVLRLRSEFTPAVHEFRSVLEVRERTLGPHHADTLSTRHSLALALRGLGRWAEAADEYREVLAKRTELLGPDDLETLATRNQLAVVLRDLGHFGEARAEFEEVLRGRLRAHDGNQRHRDVLSTRNQLAGVLARLGELAAAETQWREVVQIRRQVLGPTHPYTLIVRQHLGKVRLDQGDPDGAAAELDDLLVVQRQVYGRDNDQVFGTRVLLARIALARGRHDLALGEFTALLQEQRRALGEDHPYVLETLFQHALARRATGDAAGAEEELSAVVAGRVRQLGDDHPDTRAAAEALSSLRAT
jgi:tetratricopeptide (TPR) repeat protein